MATTTHRKIPGLRASRIIIADYLNGAPGVWINLTDIARIRALRQVHFNMIMKAAASAPGVTGRSGREGLEYTFAA